MSADKINSGKKLPTSPTNSTSSDSSLDYSSEKFNPFKALYAPKVKIKVKNYAKYDNLAMFETALGNVGAMNVGNKQGQPTRPVSSTKTPKASTSSGVDNNLPNRRFLPHQRPIKTDGMKKRHTRNLFTKIEEFTGPLGALRDFMKNHKKVTVYTRKEHGVRGKTTGYLICFDKHWNLLLTDVTETWKRRKYEFSENNTNCGTPSDCTKRLKKLGIKIPKTEVKSLNRKYVECTRKVNQIMIRGEQVVLVSAAAAIDIADEKIEGKS